MIKSPLNYIGGCNVGINVNAQKVIFNDNLNYLIDMYDFFMLTNVFDY